MLDGTEKELLLDLINEIRKKIIGEGNFSMTEDQKIEEWEIKKYLDNFWKER